MIHLTLLMFTALSMGLLGSVHCVGMCGGIVSALCFSCPQNDLKGQASFNVNYHLAYNLGRIATYTLLGALTGLFGILVTKYLGSSAGYILRIIANLSIITVGLYIAGWSQQIALLEKIGSCLWQPVSKIIGIMIPIKSKYHATFLGGVWGFLPCGLVYSALLYSLSSGNLFVGAAIMLCFGLGTLPSMLLIGSAMQSYRHLFQHKLARRLSGATMVCFGMISIAIFILNHTAVKTCAHCH